MYLCMSFDLFYWFSRFTPPLYCFFVQSAVVTLNCNNGPCYFFERWFLESFQFLDPPTYWNSKWKCMLPFVSTWLIFPFFTSFAMISCSLGSLHLYTIYLWITWEFTDFLVSYGILLQRKWYKGKVNDPAKAWQF